jgi:aspartyl-tRNA synthetase
VAERFNYFDGFGFLIEHLLQKSNSRARLSVPATQPGHYALPQSPQLFKQILMVSGFDCYFQIVRCFRDEDLRSDRQPEFTQIDVEMSFVQVEDIKKTMEGLMAHIFKEVVGMEIETPFPSMSYAEAMDRYGVDKPDLRFGMELKDLSDVLRGSGFKVFEEVLKKGGTIKALCVKGGFS